MKSKAHDNARSLGLLPEGRRQKRSLREQSHGGRTATVPFSLSLLLSRDKGREWHLQIEPVVTWKNIPPVALFSIRCGVFKRAPRKDTRGKHRSSSEGVARGGDRARRDISIYLGGALFALVAGGEYVQLRGSGRQRALIYVYSP